MTTPMGGAPGMVLRTPVNAKINGPADVAILHASTDRRCIVLAVQGWQYKIR